MKFPAPICGASERNCAEAELAFALKRLNAIHPSTLEQAEWYSCEGELNRLRLHGENLTLIERKSMVPQLQGVQG